MEEMETLGYQELLLLPKHFTPCLVGVSGVISEALLLLYRVPGHLWRLIQNAFYFVQLDKPKR